MSTQKQSPLNAIKRFAKTLGWFPLKRFRHTLPDVIITWYESGLSEGGRFDCFLQINECPIGQQKSYSAAVYAPRFRLCSGWHCFKLSEVSPDEAAEQLASWLAVSHFNSASGRRAYRDMHPETVGYSWEKIRRDGPPYQILDSEAGLTIRCR